MIRPPKLNSGDKVRLISTARKISAEDLEPCVEELKSWGLEPEFGAHLFEEDNQYAGTDSHRLADLQAALDDPDLKCILCARGGYGTLRILDQVNLDGLLKHPKWIIGFSDVTPLLLRCFAAGIESVHGPMGISFDGKTGDDSSREFLRKILMEDRVIEYIINPEDQSKVRPGKAKGRILGGNLTLLSHCVGTLSDFDPTGCILFYEDLDEYLYNIDRLILHLKRSRKFEGLAGLLVGGITDLKDNTVPFGKTGEEIAWEHAAGYAWPLVMGFPVGHWERNYPLVIGREAELEISHVKAVLRF
ncbi:MAG: LD-carboxypeptidase [Bacteroidia bacterium]|nr:LD-carboxypeptidase [Bacteroidia bacterium]